MTNDKLDICPKCGCDGCYITPINETKNNYFCWGCGFQIFDLCHLVDPSGDHASHRGSGANHSYPGSHDRNHQQTGSDIKTAGSRAWS